jgi:hypothetical protein
MSAGATRWLVAALLGITAFIIVLSTQRHQGIPRDEVTYMHYGSRYANWWIGLATGDSRVTSTSITDHFGGERINANNREHPPLMKTLFGLSEALFHQHLGWTSRITAYRLPTGALLGVLVALVVLFAARVWGLAEGVVAGLLTLLLPRALFHSGLACLDAPVTALWFATIYAYYRALSSRWWCLTLGIAFGLALATKHNALFLPIAILAHYAGVARLEHGGGGLKGFFRGLWGRQPLIGVALLVVGPVVLIALWPWLWFDTVDHIRDWIGFHWRHVHYNYEYLGRNYTHPPFPWHVPLVTTLLTTPIATLAAFAVGLVVVLRRKAEVASDSRAPGLLLFAAAFAAMAAFLLRTTPIFGAEKHWAAAMPPLCIVAAVGVVWAARQAMASLLGSNGRRRSRLAGVAAISAVVVSAAAAETFTAQPYALSHYNALAGGADGGADLGMNRQFWGYAARGVLPWLNRHTPATGQPVRPVFTHDAAPAWLPYRREGLLAPGLPGTGLGIEGIQRSRFALVIHERHFAYHDILIWKIYGTVRPAHVLTSGGVPIVSVYSRPGPR